MTPQQHHSATEPFEMITAAVRFLGHVHDMAHAPEATGTAVDGNGLVAYGCSKEGGAVLSWRAVERCIRRHGPHAHALRHWGRLALKILVAGLVVVNLRGGACRCACLVGLVDSIKACMDAMDELGWSKFSTRWRK